MTEPQRRALLDTSVLIDFPADVIAEFTEEVAVSAVSVAELYFGIALAGDPVTQLVRRRRVQSIVERFDVLPFDAITADYYGTLAGLVRQYGRNPRPRRMVLQIAATAARHGLPLVTHNEQDFDGLGSAVTVIGL